MGVGSGGSAVVNGKGPLRVVLFSVFENGGGGEVGFVVDGVVVELSAICGSGNGGLGEFPLCAVVGSAGSMTVVAVKGIGPGWVVGLA
jgi:hypothetical protein